MNGSWDAYLAFPADFAGVDDIITNLAKEKEPWIKIFDHLKRFLKIMHQKLRQKKQTSNG